LILVSGKMAIDLMTSEQYKSADAVAICRVEQLYPLPLAEIEAAMRRYPALEDLVWAQEEPENMGGWHYAAPYLRMMLRGELALRLLARPRSSSPAEGSAARHTRVQQQLIARAFDLGTPAPTPPPVSSQPRTVAAGTRE
jgi:2-oxoglutarate dehydrogenase E1 component